MRIPRLTKNPATIQIEKAARRKVATVNVRCPQPGTILMGYPPLLLLRELSRWLPISQPCITLIDPNCGQPAWSP
jgi:hypothetical protein